MQETLEDDNAPAIEPSQDASFLADVTAALEAGNRDRLVRLTSELPEADLADLIELLEPDARLKLVTLLGDDLKPATLSELETSVRDQLLDDLPNEQIAAAVRELDSDDAVYLLEDMEESEQSDVLAKLSEAERVAVQRSLDYPEDSAGRLMQTEFIAVPPFWSVGQTIDYLRETEGLPDTFSELYVVDPVFHLLGGVRLDRILRAKRPTPIREIMDGEPATVFVNQDQEDVARLFERYDLLSAAVVDADKRLVGVVTVDDVVEVIQEEAGEDILRLGGVSDESVADRVLRITRRRFPWLLVNLFTAFLASLVIGLFDATIEQMVALAVLMPIVASMGGNAATQTMTIAVRALATKELTPVNAFRVITREAAVGLINGLLFALIVAGITVLWFANTQLGVIIAAAMIFNMLAAALAGILIPIGLERAGADPAVASSVFVTTVTDIVGFFAFLGLAALWLT